MRCSAAPGHRCRCCSGLDASPLIGSSLPPPTFAVLQLAVAREYVPGSLSGADPRDLTLDVEQQGFDERMAGSSGSTGSSTGGGSGGDTSSSYGAGSSGSDGAGSSMGDERPASAGLAAYEVASSQLHHAQCFIDEVALYSGEVVRLMPPPPPPPAATALAVLAPAPSHPPPTFSLVSSFAGPHPSARPLHAGTEEGGAGAQGVRLMTMHAAKGLEFEAVFIPGALVQQRGGGGGQGTTRDAALRVQPA